MILQASLWRERTDSISPQKARALTGDKTNFYTITMKSEETHKSSHVNPERSHRWTASFLTFILTRRPKTELTIGLARAVTKTQSPHYNLWRSVNWRPPPSLQTSELFEPGVGAGYVIHASNSVVRTNTITILASLHLSCVHRCMNLSSRPWWCHDNSSLQLRRILLMIF